MIRVPVVSSNIRSVGWDEGTLEVAFNNGGIYQYLNVPVETYRALMEANSKGQYLNQHIKEHFMFHKVEPADA